MKCCETVYKYKNKTLLKIENVGIKCKHRIDILKCVYREINYYFGLFVMTYDLEGI